jgi:hypothetical protein
MGEGGLFPGPSDRVLGREERKIGPRERRLGPGLLGCLGWAGTRVGLGFGFLIFFHFLFLFLFKLNSNYLNSNPRHSTK